MNPQGFLPMKPLPMFVVNMGQSVADLVKLTTGMDVPYHEGLMLIVSTIAMAVFIVLWIIVDIGNRADKSAHQAVLEARCAPANRMAQARRSMELERLQEMARTSVMGSGSSDTVEVGSAGGGAYAEKLYRRESSGNHGVLRKKVM